MKKFLLQNTSKWKSFRRTRILEVKEINFTSKKKRQDRKKEELQSRERERETEREREQRPLGNSSWGLKQNRRLLLHKNYHSEEPENTPKKPKENFFSKLKKKKRKNTLRTTHQSNLFNFRKMPSLFLSHHLHNLSLFVYI